MSQAVLRPNLTNKFQWEVSQNAERRSSQETLQHVTHAVKSIQTQGFPESLKKVSVNLNHLINNAMTKYPDNSLT